MDKILRINMGADGGPAIKTEPVGDYAGFGGRGLTSAIVSKEVPPLCHPLGEDNKLIIPIILTTVNNFGNCMREPANNFPSSGKTMHK